MNYTTATFKFCSGEFSRKILTKKSKKLQNCSANAMLHFIKSSTSNLLLFKIRDVYSITDNFQAKTNYGIMGRKSEKAYLNFMWQAINI